MNSLKNIICGIDFSMNSKSALRQAARIADWNAADVTAIHVLDKGLFNIFPEVSRNEIEIGAVKHLEELVFEVLGDASKTRQEVFVGNVFRQLADFVAEEDGDLLVLGVNGHGTDKGEPSIAGATARKCVRKIPAKVLLVRGDQTGDFRSIVHCTDFSSPASLAFEQAIAIAREENASLELIHSMIAPERLLHGLGDTIPAEHLDPEIMRLRTEEEMRKYVAPFAAELKGLEMKTTIVEAADKSVGKTLVDAIASSGADLAVLGTHGCGAIAGLLMGTTAEKIISHAPCSILAVKPESFKTFW